MNTPKYFPLPTQIGKRAYAFAAMTSLASLAIGAFAGLPGLMTTGSPAWPFLYSLFFWFDPNLLQFIALCHCAICLAVWSGDNKVESQHRWEAIASTIFVLVFVFLLFYLVNDLLFKAAFDRPRPAPDLQRNWGIISNVFSPTTAGGAPSGYASRGSMLLIIATLASLGLKENRSGLRRIFAVPKVVFTFQLILLVLTCTFRVLTGLHFWFDVFIGISLGTFLTWAMLLFASAFLERAGLIHDIDSVAILVASIIIGFVIIGFFYSRDASAWAAAAITIIIVSLFIQLRGNSSTQA